MRLSTFDSKLLRQYLQRHRIATIDELKGALGSSADLTVFRKLKPLGYRTSYTHRGRYYTLDAIARFDDDGLWSNEGVWFSRRGTLLATAEHFVTHAPQGCFAHELADTLHVEVQDALHQLVQTERLRRTEAGGLYLYTAPDPSTHRLQLSSRRMARTVPLAANVGALQVSPDELQSAIVLFYSLLDEQQRRLFAGLESIRLGHGGDTLLADFLGLDSHTVARGRQQLLDRDIAGPGRTRRKGGGRNATEKKRPE
ncbi:MAG: hypothetical protein HY040_27690 [Planctomycetes bacterium]|nr:hypothetical protein [Planctomycetota bacterium]